MASAGKDELHLPHRTQRPVGLFGATLRALAVMAVLDVALMVLVDDEEPASAPAVALEAPVAQADADPVTTAPSGEAPAALPADAHDDLGAPAETEIAAAPAPAALPAASQEPPAAGTAIDPMEASLPTEAIAALPPRLTPGKAAEPVPAPAAAAQPIPAAATHPLPVEAPAQIVLPSSKPRPPASFLRSNPARRTAPHAHHETEAPVRRGNIVEAAAAPRAIARAAGPPPCRRYTAATTLQGDAGPVRGIACPGPNGTWHIITERASLD